MSTVDAPMGLRPRHVTTASHVVVFTETDVAAYDVTTNVWPPVGWAPYPSPQSAGGFKDDGIRAVSLGADVLIFGVTTTARLGPVSPWRRTESRSDFRNSHNKPAGLPALTA